MPSSSVAPASCSTFSVFHIPTCMLTTECRLRERRVLIRVGRLQGALHVGYLRISGFSIKNREACADKSGFFLLCRLQGAPRVGGAVWGS
jgi:hypothetical protein